MYSLFGIVAALLDYALLVKEGILVYAGAVVGGLSTELAVLRAFSAASVDDAAKVHSLPTEGCPYHVSSTEESFRVSGEEY